MNFPHVAPTGWLDMEPKGSSLDGRFVVYGKFSAGAGTRRGAATPAKFIVFDRQTGRATNLQRRADIDCLIHHRLTGEETSPWFVGRSAKAPKAEIKWGLA